MLTYLGLSPGYPNDSEWFFWDLVDIGLGKWVLIEQKRGVTPLTLRAAGVFKYGKWTAPIAPAVYVEDLPGAAITRDARYLWRAPNIAPNRNPPPVPPQGIGPSYGDLPGVTDSTEWVRSTGPTAALPILPDGMSPGDYASYEDYQILDGSPTRWANVSIGIRYTVDGGGSDVNLRPVNGVVVINGKAVEVLGWRPWTVSPNYNEGYLAGAWINWGGTGSWEQTSWTVPLGTTMYNRISSEIGLGSRYAVVVSRGADPDTGDLVDIVVIDRSKGTARMTKILQAEARTGPVVLGTKAIFYALISAVGPEVYRVILDLVTLEWKTEDTPAEQTPLYMPAAPSYMTDVPRVVGIESEGSGEQPRKLAMDNDVVDVIGAHLSLSGSNIVLRPYIAPSYGGFQQDTELEGNFIEVIAWSPDSNLAGGDNTLKGYFL